MLLLAKDFYTGIEELELLKLITSHLLPVYHKNHRAEKLRVGQHSAQTQ